MNRRQLLTSSLALAGGTLLKHSLYAKGNIIEPAENAGGEGIKTFRINFGRERIKDLHHRLDNTYWPDMPFDTGWTAGTNDKVLKDLVKYWRNDYDWFKEQDKLNQLAHFKATIDGEQIHFVQYKGSGKRQKFPLLLMHGWPSSFIEFSDAAPMLVNGINGQAGYDLIVPSLPGFVFSDVPKQAGLHPVKIAKRLHLLMTELGYDKYGIAGLDWGSFIGGSQARLFPEAVIGFHSSGIPWARPAQDKVLSDEEKKFLAFQDNFDKEGLGYSVMQRTKPQTLAYGLQDSPVGLLAWILEKYWAWSDHGEDLWQTFDRNKILTTVMLYWLTGTVLSASRIYYENKNTPESEKTTMPAVIPIARARFPKNPFGGAPASLLDSKNEKNIIQVTEYTKGGHFPPMEQPVLWSEDVARFFSKL